MLHVDIMVDSFSDAWVLRVSDGKRIAKTWITGKEIEQARSESTKALFGFLNSKLREACAAFG